MCSSDLQLASSDGPAWPRPAVGRVEVDETYLGGLEEGARGRQTDRKALIVIAAQEDGPPNGARIGPGVCTNNPVNLFRHAAPTAFPGCFDFQSPITTKK